MVQNVDECLKKKDRGPQKRKNYVLGPKIATLVPARISYLLSCLEYFRLARSYNCVG